MKKIITLLFIGLLSFSIYPQEKKVAKISFKTTTIDYGSIEKGSNGLRTFEFTNTGTAPLIISQVSSTCGCTIPKKPEAPIMPGQSDKIEVKYNTNILGPISKTISVISTAEEPAIALKIRGSVVDKKGESVIEKKNKSLLEN